MTTSSNGNMILSEEDLKVLEKDIISVANSKPSISMARPVTPVTIVDAPLQVPAIPSSSLSHLLNGTSVTSHPTAMSSPSNSNNNTIPLLNETHSSHASPSIHPIEDSLSHQFTSISIATINNTPVNTSNAMSIPIEYMNTPPAQSFASPSSSLMSTTLLPSKYGQSPSSIPTINSTITNSSNPCTTNNTISSDVQRHLLEKSSWNATSIPSLMTRSTSEELPSNPSSHFTTATTTISTNTSINEQSTQHSFHLNRYGHRQSLSAHTSPTIDPFAPLEYRSMVDHGNTETTRFNPLQYFHEQSHNELISTSKPSLPSSITTDPNDNYSLSSLPPTALLSNHTVIDDIPYYFPDATHE
ncbi:hypothetical protein BDF22DRAFT_378043 [Syncephalis plumigaleata]|nr:hypothetical protein BDF22DRAFT_378043 [Syncephalis plumigaleata]